jgi:signal transduction histidine kinase
VSRFRSILSRIVALHVVAIAAISIFMSLALHWLIEKEVDKLHANALRGRADAIAGFLKPQPAGGVALDFPPEIRPLYSGGPGFYSYAILDAERRVIFSSRADGAPLFAVGDGGGQGWTMNRPDGDDELFGVSVKRTIGDRPYWIQVGEDRAQYYVIIDDVTTTSLLPYVAWIAFPILGVLLLLIDIFIFRRALEPVRDASTAAASIGPATTELRLPEQSMPVEIAPLVRAVNRALDRLDAGFEAQRAFTADMAHELRTPLAIVRARIDSLDPGPVREALRADLVSMTRTVNQVLDIAELESFAVGAGQKADLHAICAEAVTFMAPLAVDASKTIALTGAPGPVWVRGHSEALYRAVRNLIENAIRHTPQGTSIEVEVSADGTVRVLDDGPGISPGDRDSIFRRFWRRDRVLGGGCGLGLAIVTRVAEAHGGTIDVEDRPGGGAVFALHLHPA